MSTLDGNSSLPAVQASYDTNASYMEDNSVPKARAFITACRILIRRTPAEFGTRESHTRMSVDLLQKDMAAAIEWLNANDNTGTGSPTAGVSRFGFNNCRS